MPFRGNRRAQLLLACVLVLVALVVVVVVVNREDHPYDEPVGTSTLEGFPTRGPLADDEDVVESAADVWRKADRNHVETKPNAAIELLWAGTVETEAVENLVTDKDSPDDVRVVVLRSGREIATFAERQVDSDHAFDGMGIEEMSTYESPVIDVPGLLALAGESSPTTYEAVDERGSSWKVEAVEGLVSTTREGAILQLDQARPARFGRDDTPGLFMSGDVVALAPGDVDRVWTMLNNPARGDALRRGIGMITGSSRDRPALERPTVEIVHETTTPEDRLLLVLAADNGSTIRTAAAVDYDLAEDDDAPVAVSLGRGDGLVPDSAWVGSAWVRRDGEVPYVVVAGGGATRMMEVHLGRRSVTLSVPGGVVEVDEDGAKQNALPGLVVAGFTADGRVVPTMPTG